ncbi:uncharacterized protein [Diabrotica undecimpunctata]|uniref:uncharacterized protein n=1 Tax=Diabrotica undecimpunctata TaxID=50387 RepID=UPI003B639036
MTNLVPSENPKVDFKEIALVYNYKYLSHKIQIARDTLTATKHSKEAWTIAWTSYRALLDIFKSKMPNYLKKKTFDQCVLPVMAYGAVTVSFTQATATKLRVAQRIMERLLVGFIL